jgi:uncharacterized SAM-binding protein YcdF (DUF218 family)
VAGVVGAALVAYFALTLWWVHRVGRSDQARTVDAIVVMGAAQYDGRPSPQLAARLDHALDLYERGLAPLVVTTGGKLPADRFTEAEASREYLVERGVPEAAILAVEGATTLDSLALVADAMRGADRPTVLVVSDPFHSLRARLAAEEVGLEAYVSPTRTSPVRGVAAFRREVKEAAGVAVGRLVGFRRLQRLTG